MSKPTSFHKVSTCNDCVHCEIKTDNCGFTYWFCQKFGFRMNSEKSHTHSCDEFELWVFSQKKIQEEEKQL
jgi:hypothetical protein